MSVRILIGECREQLRALPADSVHCVVTSPPYWGLRDYNVPPSVWGGDAECDHAWGEALPARPGRGNKPGDLSTSTLTNPERQDSVPRPKDAGAFCQHCGAWYGVLGLEPDYRLHVAHLVEVFAEVRRVLRPDGTVWLNYGDCYATTPQGNPVRADGRCITPNDDRTKTAKPFSTIGGGLKPKDLAMLPARVAIALQDDGWWLRSDIIWHKPNPMPESIKDRPTNAHEHVFLLAKSARYFFDAEAVREDVTGNAHPRRKDGETLPAKDEAGTFNRRIGTFVRKSDKQRGHSRRHAGFNDRWDQMPKAEQAENGRHIRNVWMIATKPFPEAHFATFPPELVEPCIKGGCPEGGTVLDPFGGAGTVGLVADRLKRDAILIELNPDYAAIAERRIADDGGLFGDVEVAA